MPVDSLIERFDAVADGDLMITRRGVAYQADMSSPVAYDEAYFDKCAGYEGKDIGDRINAGRLALVDRHAGADARLLDIGVGSGEFVRRRPHTWGFDVNPKARAWLESAGRWADDLREFGFFSFWDVLEHVPEPNRYFRRMGEGAWLFCSLPVFEDLGRIRESRHYRPDEHFYYFTRQGFVDWMALYRFELAEASDHETLAGRDSIAAFAFRRTLPGYHDTLAQYRALHAPAYGVTAELYFDAIARLVLARDPASILDYGCGRSSLAAHFWKDGGRRIARYDPAIPEFMSMPEGTFDMALCTDVLEHVRMEDVGRVLAEIRTKAASAVFTISLKPARQKLPDGRNAHVTLLTADEWLRWIADVFGRAERVPVQWDHICMVKTF